MENRSPNPCGEFSIRFRVWGEISPHRKLNGEKFIPVGFTGTGLVCIPPSPFPAGTRYKLVYVPCTSIYLYIHVNDDIIIWEYNKYVNIRSYYVCIVKIWNHIMWYFVTYIVYNKHILTILSGDRDPRWEFIPAGNGDGEKILPASINGDTRGGKFLSWGWGWGGNPRRGIPRWHLEA